MQDQQRQLLLEKVEEKLRSFGGGVPFPGDLAPQAQPDNSAAVSGLAARSGIGVSPPGAAVPQAGSQMSPIEAQHAPEVYGPRPPTFDERGMSDVQALSMEQRGAPFGLYNVPRSGVPEGLKATERGKRIRRGKVPDSPWAGEDGPYGYASPPGDTGPSPLGLRANQRTSRPRLWSTDAMDDQDYANRPQPRGWPDIGGSIKEAWRGEGYDSPNEAQRAYREALRSGQRPTPPVATEAPVANDEMKARVAGVIASRGKDESSVSGSGPVVTGGEFEGPMTEAATSAEGTLAARMTPQRDPRWNQVGVGEGADSSLATDAMSKFDKDHAAQEVRKEKDERADKRKWLEIGREVSEGLGNMNLTSAAEILTNRPPRKLFGEATGIRNELAKMDSEDKGTRMSELLRRAGVEGIPDGATPDEINMLLKVRGDERAAKLGADKFAAGRGDAGKAYELAVAKFQQSEFKRSDDFELALRELQGKLSAAGNDALPPKVLEEMTGALATARQLEGVLSAKVEHGINTGWAAGRWMQFMHELGFTNAKEADFVAKNYRALVAYIFQMTGKQMSKDEAKRIGGGIQQMKNSNEAFRKILLEMRQAVLENGREKLGLYNPATYDTEYPLAQFDKRDTVIVSSTADPTQKKKVPRKLADEMVANGTGTYEY